MSIANLMEPNRYDLYSHSLDTTTDSLLLGYVTAPRIDLGATGTAVFISGQPYAPNPFPPTPTVPQRVAYFSGNTITTLDDCNITVSGANNEDLTFQADANIYCDNIDAVDNDVLSLGLSTAEIYIGVNPPTNILQIGHEGLTVSVSEGVATNYVRTVSLDRNMTNDPIFIGDTYATTINMSRSGHEVNIVTGALLRTDQIDSVNPVSLFVNSPFITFGGSAVQMNGSLSFMASGPSGLNYFTESSQSPVQGSGPFVAQDCCAYTLQRLNSIVNIDIRWTVGSILATANAQLTIGSPIPAAYRPTNFDVFLPCYARSNGITYINSFVRVTMAGDIIVSPTMVPAATFLIGDQIDFNSISIAYSVSL